MAIATQSRKSSKFIAPGTQVNVTVIEKPVIETEATVDKDKVIQYDGLEILGILKSFEGLESTLVTETKNEMLKQGAKRCESASYEAQISGGGPSRYIAPDLFFAMCKRKNIKQSQINEVVKISAESIKFLTEDDIEKLYVKGAGRQPSLTVTRRKTAPPLKVTDAITKVADRAKEGKFPEMMPAKSKK